MLVVLIILLIYTLKELLLIFICCPDVSISRPYAYKIKKEITFGEILDFSTLQLRKKIYQKDKAVIKILQEKYNHKVKIAGPDDRGHILEYAIKMLGVSTTISYG